MTPPDEFVLQRAGGHRMLHAAFHGHLQRGAVLLKQEVPPLRRPGTDHKHGHGDVNREAANRRLSVYFDWWPQVTAGVFCFWICFLQTSWCRQSPSIRWTAGWLWSRRVGSFWSSRTATSSSSALAPTLIQSHSTLVYQSGPGTNSLCSPVGETQSAHKSGPRVFLQNRS